MVSLKLLCNRGDDEIVLGLVVDLLLEGAEESSKVDAARSYYVRWVNERRIRAEATVGKA